MSLLNNFMSYDELIKFSTNGIEVADYSQIRAAFTERFKQIYGRDIDTSTLTADGQFIEMISLMISNILESFKGLYASLDAKTARGNFLDILSNFSNVTRKTATNSTANLLIENLGSMPVTTSTISFLDQSGTEWIWNSGEGIEVTFEPGVQQSIIATCSELGPIRADAGWINSTATLDYSFSVIQPNNASMGRNLESDTQLRARRNDSLAIRGTTVLGSLQGALMSLHGIDDVRIYENTSPEDMTVNDGTILTPHSVYIILRRADNVIIDNRLIGSIIFERMTPGIRTNQTTADPLNGISEQHNYDPGSHIIEEIFWKRAIPLSPEIRINVMPLNYFSREGEFTANHIARNVAEYMNNLRLSESVRPIDVQMQAMSADPTFRGMPTYVIQSVLIDGSANTYNNPNTFFNYEGTVTVEDAGEGILTLIIR